MWKFSLGYQVLLAVILGIFVGFFFGPLAENLKPIGTAYTMLLQMAVLPYICFSLIHGLGSMTPKVGKKVLKSGWPYLLGLWVLIFFIIYLLSNLFPETLPPIIKTEGPDDFKSNFAKNFLTNLIPQNPLYDIANNVVPAVAVFGLIGGIALMHVTKKEPLIGVLERINQTIEKVLDWLGILSPIGVFAYISISFGTIYFADLYKIQLYVVPFILTTLFLTFWVLPVLLSTLTPMSFKEAVSAIRYVCLLPFLTGLGPAALPFLNRYLVRLSKKHETHDNFRETSQTILPIAYSFGNIGNALILLFIFFLAYYYRHPFSGLETTLISILTIPLSIGSSTSNTNSIEFLLKQLGFPQGAFDFYLQIKAFTYNFHVMMNIASVLTLIILTIYAYHGLLRFKWKRFTSRLGSSFLIYIALVFVLKHSVHIQDAYNDLYMKLKLTEVIAHPVEAEILPLGQTGVPRTYEDPNIPNIFKQILTSKVLKVGFNSDSIPFCYYNDQQQLVGYDIAYAYELAHDLGCKLQLVPFLFDNLAEMIEKGDFDLGMSSIIMSEDRLLQMDFTFAYYEDNNVLIVPRAKKDEYLDLKNILAKKGLRIGAGGEQIVIAKRRFPEATVVNLEEMELFVKGAADVILWSETTAIIWCLTHPDYVSISYGNRIGKSFFAFPFRKHGTDFGFYLNNWLTLKEQSGFKTKMQSYWIDGIRPNARAPRWSVLRNVLHFGQ